MNNIKKNLISILRTSSNSFDKSLIAQGYFAALNACGIILDSELFTLKEKLLGGTDFPINNLLRYNTVTWNQDDINSVLDAKKLPRTKFLQNYLADSMKNAMEDVTSIGWDCMNSAAANVVAVPVFKSEITGNMTGDKTHCIIYATKDVFIKYLRIMHHTTYSSIPEETIGFYDFAVRNNGFLGVKPEKEEYLVKMVRDLKPRIKNLLLLANDCQKNGFTVNKFQETRRINDDSYEKGTFVTNRLSHRLGFVSSSSPNDNTNFTIKELGIAGCESLDFRTDGQNVYSVYNTGRCSGSKTEPTLEHLEKFIESFDAFEKAFFEYVAICIWHAGFSE